MPTINEQLLRLKDYPARLVVGRATPQGVLVRVDDRILPNADYAIARIRAYESMDDQHLQPAYHYEVVPQERVESAMESMRLDLQKEAHDKGLPTKDWK